jgi:hypothetical protein
MPGFEQGYAFIVGVADYPNVRPLPQTVLNDARDIATMLQRADRAAYPPGQVRVILNNEATKANILAGLDWLAKNATSDATAVFFFSGHGGRIESGADAGNYLIPYDTVLSTIKKTAIGSEELTTALNQIKTKRMVVLLDACHAGGTGNTKGDLEPDNTINLGSKSGLEVEPSVKGGLDEQTYTQLQHGEGRVIVASSRSSEKSYVMPGAKNSVFTETMLEAFEGKGGHNGSQVRIFDLVNYVFDEVPKRQPLQNPIFKATDLDKNFPLALLFGGKGLEPNISSTPSSSSGINADTAASARKVPIQQTALANASVQLKIRNTVTQIAPDIDALDQMCQLVTALIVDDGWTPQTASPALFQLSTSSLGVKYSPLATAASKIVDQLNRSFKLPYLLLALREMDATVSDAQLSGIKIT